MHEAASAELVKFTVVDGESIPTSLTGKPGDPVNGRKVAINRKLGNCLACHTLPAPEQQFHGVIGADLRGIASRYSQGELRLRIVNSKILNPESFMPAFYRNTGLTRVLKKWKGKTILKAQQVEDVLAYLATLKEVSFGEAFAAARKMGQSSFKWQDKMYNAKLKGE
jgi:sulfur-oxidizing protein SoxX